VTDFPSGNDPSLKSIFVISPEIPELDLTRWSDRDIDGQRVDGDGNLRVEEALHAQRPCEQGSLGEIFVLRQGQEGAVEVLVWNENEDMLAWVGSKREDARNGSFCGSKCAIMASAKTVFDACAIGEGEEGNDEMVRVWDWVYVDGVVVCRGLVCKVNDGCSMSRYCWGAEGIEYSGVRPCETCCDAEDREGGGEEGGEWGGNGVGGEVESRGVVGGEGA